MDKLIENRKRCLNCKYYGRNVCSFLNADVFNIDKCILDNENVKNLKEGSPEWFMFQNNILLYLKYLNYKRRDILPKKNTKVVTLVSGFCGYAGCIRYIVDVNYEKKYFVLTDFEGFNAILNGEETLESLHESYDISICYFEEWDKSFFEI